MSFIEFYVSLKKYFQRTYDHCALYFVLEQKRKIVLIMNFKNDDSFLLLFNYILMNLNDN